MIYSEPLNSDSETSSKMERCFPLQHEEKEETCSFVSEDVSPKTCSNTTTIYISAPATFSFFACLTNSEKIILSLIYSILSTDYVVYRNRRTADSS